ncbi:MAG: formate hydrogenlyase subunit 4 [Candidatus Altiarchaeales archaeon ex4484_96]|nr:MAG: formate hydrogenlyase subunit 4 [Candidatus Altiarchaeales archaeon ex4484_96]
MMWINIALIPVAGIVALLIGLFYAGLDRIIAARMQERVGPPITQPLLDVAKLMIKQNIVPEHSTGWLFNLMPIVCLASTLAILFYLPFGGYAPLLGEHGDLILVLYMLIIPALAMVLGGFSSGSPYATVGAQRKMVLMMSYEFPLAISVISIAWLLTVSNIADPFSLQSITKNPVWGLVGPLGLVGLILQLLVLLFVIPGELGRIPFDVHEATSEIAGGLLVEYSGRNLALFYLADAVKVVVFTSVIIALFFPYGVGLSGWWGVLADAVFYFVKLFVLMFFCSTLIRVAMSRFKITQVVYAYWIPAIIVSLTGLLLVLVDALS